MRVGILGGGQLAQMLILAGVPLGIEFLCLDPQKNCPASRVATNLVQADYNNVSAVQAFANGVDVVTFESETISAATLTDLSKPVYPAPNALRTAQDRLTEKQFFTTLQIPVTPFLPVDSEDDLAHAISTLGLPLLLKTRCQGYDGKGQQRIHSLSEGCSAIKTLSPQPLIAEKWVSFDTEVSLIAARNSAGEIRYYPLVENFHQDGILRYTKAPFTNEPLTQSAQDYTTRVLEKLNYVGILTIEFFVNNQQLIANEMAPRVHNSGHWTIEGATTSQFENHLRAILGLPLGETNASGHCAMINFIGTLPPLTDLLNIPSLHVHDYGKDPKPNRKLGHATLCTHDSISLTQQLSVFL